LLGVAMPARADAPPPTNSIDVELAKAHYRTGEIYYEHQRYPDAAREFEEAFRLSKRAEFLYNMGRSYDRAGDPARALSAYRRFTEALPGSRDSAEVSARVEVLRRQVTRLHVSSTVEGAIVQLDGAVIGPAPIETLEVNPGAHQVDVAHEGYGTYRQKIAAHADEDVAIAGAPVSLVKVIHIKEKETTPVYKRWWPWTIAAAGVLVAGGIATAVVLTRNASSTPEFQLPQVRMSP
jgi:tetratricopeptide (TPR) repeat protein